MKLKLFLSGLLGLLTVAAMAQPEDAELRRQMQAFYARMDGYIAKGDTNAVVRTMDPNYVYTDVQGHRMGYAEMKTMMMNMQSTMKGAKSWTSVKHVQGNDQEAFVWVEMKTTYKRKKGTRWVAMNSTHRFAETHRRTQMGWKTVMTQELPIDEPWPFGTGR